MRIASKKSASGRILLDAHPLFTEEQLAIYTVNIARFGPEII
jgi:hypothetical protein